MTSNNNSRQRRRRYLLELDLYALARLSFSAESQTQPHNATKETQSTESTVCH
jgi:hypothetical protein